MTLERDSLIDCVTGLPNRRAMALFAERELNRRALQSDVLCFGLIRLDYFDHPNQSYLLPESDRILVDVANILVNTIRKGDFIGRVDGNEFCVIAPETTRDAANVLRNRITERIRTSLGIDCAIGFVLIGGVDTASFDEIKVRAAAALREARMLNKGEKDTQG